MKIVLDTNVFVSGIFFSGPPSQILRAWSEGRIRIAYSPPIILEYQRVLADLSQQFPGTHGEHFLEYLQHYGELVRPDRLSKIPCRDPDDVKFLDCLVCSKARCLVTGDKDLLEIQRTPGVILTPREFCDRYPKLMAR